MRPAQYSLDIRSLLLKCSNACLKFYSFNFFCCNSFCILMSIPLRLNPLKVKEKSFEKSTMSKWAGTRCSMLELPENVRTLVCAHMLALSANLD